MTSNFILENIDNPDTLENAYQRDSALFATQLAAALEANDNSETLRVWHARLNYIDTNSTTRTRFPIGLLIAFVALAGLIAKLPALIPMDEEWYYPRFIPFALFTGVILYFLKLSQNIRIGKIVGSSIILCAIYAVLLPAANGSDSVIMALIHLPLLSLTLMAISFMSDNWKEVQPRLAFIRYLGEMAIYTVLVLLGGIVLTGITLGLFSLIELEIQEWYTRNIVVIGVVSAPVVATYLFDSVQNRQSKFAITLANVFAPLFLITVVAYLVASVYQGKSPYTNRDFLILFNGLLLIILAITIFSIVGRSGGKKAQLSDFINIALLGATLIVNVIALSAIVFRWAEYGLTLNRIVVTGANLLIFIHLALLLKQYLRQVFYAGEFSDLEAVIAKFLPVYSAWSLIVALLLPIVFQFR